MISLTAPIAGIMGLKKVPILKKKKKIDLNYTDYSGYVHRAHGTVNYICSVHTSFERLDV